MMGDSDEFQRERHVSFFRLHLASLPVQYSSQESNRVTLAYFAIVALDILNALDKVDAPRTIDWIYRLQVLSHLPPPSPLDATISQSEDASCHRVRSAGSASSSGATPAGASSPLEVDVACGFRGSPSIGIACRPDGSPPLNDMDSGHIANTYTALCILRTLGDPLHRLDRQGILGSLHRMQQPDGSFCPMLPAGIAESDMRFVYCAEAITTLLGVQRTPPFDRNAALGFVVRSQTFDGGFSLAPGLEAHGGATYCALASLHLMGQIPAHAARGIARCPETLGSEPEVGGSGGGVSATGVNSTEDGGLGVKVASVDWHAVLAWCLRRQEDESGGFQGRTNKAADCCYGFWVGSSLQLLGGYEFFDHSALRKFLLSCQSKRYGGFSKYPGERPDLLHSFYGICAMSLLGEADLLPICPSLGVTQRAGASLLSHLSSDLKV